MTPQDQKSAILAVWNAAQTGDPSIIPVPISTLEKLAKVGLLREFGAHPARYFMVTGEGKQAAGLKR